jgi:hypothetical protein
LNGLERGQRLETESALILDIFDPLKDFSQFTRKNPDRVRREKPTNSRRSSLSHHLRCGSSRPETLKRLGHTVSSWRVGQEPSHAVFDDFRMTGHIRGNDRSTAQHLQHHTSNQTACATGAGCDAASASDAG